MLFATTACFSSIAAAERPLIWNYATGETPSIPADAFIQRIAYDQPNNGPPLPPVVRPEEWDEVYNDVYNDAACEPLYTPWYRRGSWVAGVDFLFMRYHHNDNDAFTRQFRPAPVMGITTETDEVIYFRSGYEGSVRPYIAYRLCDCCSEVRFTYWNLSGSSTATATATQITQFFNFEVVQLDPGQTITANNSNNTNIFDIECSRCIRLGDNCCGGCPRWDLQWSAGVRLASVDTGYSVYLSNSATRADVMSQFSGVGPRVGLQGKRYFGSSGRFSIDAGFDIALLVGQFDHELIRTSAGGNLLEVFRGSTTRTVPVIDLELGMSWIANSTWTVSAGWLVQAWWDVTGKEDEVSPGLSIFLDDANITSWDGFTIRIEALY